RLQFQAQLVRNITKRECSVVGETCFGAHRGELRHQNLDFVSSVILVRPRLDFGQRRAHARFSVFIGVAPFPFLTHGVAAFPLGSTLASSPRNCPTSVTTPTACPVPRSLTLVATAGLISTQTILTQLGSMFPVAMECSMDPRQSTTPAPLSCSAYASWAAFMSVMVSGSGPSSRKLPAST